ncbi:MULTISPECIES: GH-E family nuclease [unclassified Pseudomonas]|uniref:GH-E family nuclease n=1 Tax=unclassified Pseudomonas TaxID=196821 RepID=UPI001F5677B9|nr:MULTISPECIES: GH-E family nuclease [unclassified Pseudomonas]
MAEPLEINVNKSFVPYGGKVFASFENGWGVTVQVFEGATLLTQQEMTYAEYVALQKEALPVPLPDYPDPRLNRSPGGTNANGNTIGRVVGETAPSAVPATQANPPIEAETEAEGITGEQILDGIQLGLDVVGLIPVVGEVADIASAVISLARGDYVGAGLSLLSAIPFVGYLGTAGKATRYGAKMAEASGKAGKEVVDKSAKKTDEAAELLAKKTNPELDTPSNSNNGFKATPREKSAREMFLGRTPGKSSKTGREVQDRMRADGKLRENPITGKTEFQASDKNWYDLSKADMAHKTDAVTWWNTSGRHLGAKSKEVRKWMLDSKNYELDHFSINRSAGAKLGQTYKPPTK